MSTMVDTFMAPPGPSKSGGRPSPLRPTSFPRHDRGTNDDTLKPPKRAHTFQNGTTMERPSRSASARAAVMEVPDSPDAFETTDNDDGVEPGRASVDMGELPIELVSLIDSFIESLSARVHPIPPTIDTLSRMFQDFYELAATHVNTHISTLASRQARESSPAPSRASTARRLRAKAASLGSKDRPKITRGESEMISAEEMADKKRARKALEHKRRRLEEAVERRLCEGVYGKVYRHRSTQDEPQDDKLRSKTAALALVGINLADLGVDLGPGAEETKHIAKSRQEEFKKRLEEGETPEEIQKLLGEERMMEMREKLGGARKEFMNMFEKRYPLAKINHLKAAMRCMLDALGELHPKASADELMPMMIYTLITMPPEDLNVISDLRFIQYFRWEQKLAGEAAYCLTTLEAAISFLETVDLSTLRADESPSGPPKPFSQPNTPRAGTFPPAYAPGLSVAASAETTATSVLGSKPPPSPGGLRAIQLKNRRLSDLVNTPAQAITSAGDSIFTTADQGIKTISASLGDSYKFLVGKLGAAPAEDGQELVPKTLDDARKLVSTPPPDDDGSVSGASSIHSPEDGGDTSSIKSRPSIREDKMLSIIGGRKASRDHSADSSRSASSSKKVLFAEEREKNTATPPPTPSSNPALVESMKSLGSSLNPMARFSGISLGRFGRTTPTATPTLMSPALKEPSKSLTMTDEGDTAPAFPEIAPALPPKETPKIAPPIKRFMELQSPGDMKLGEVLDLLRDYRRLATALKDMGAFETK